MELVALPWINEADYLEFKALIAGLPATFKDWVVRQRAVAAFLQERGGAPEVTISPDEVRLYLQRRGHCAANEGDLWIMATLFQTLRTSRKGWRGQS